MPKHIAFLTVLALAPACDSVQEPPVQEESSFRCGYAGSVGLIGLDRVVIAGNPAITGDAASVFSNEVVELAGAFEIDGDVISGGRVSISGNGQPGGRIVENAGRITVEDPTADVRAAAARNDNDTIPCATKGNKCTSAVSSAGALSLSSTQHLTLSSGVYYFTGISINGQAQLDIDGDVVIYIDGAATLNGGSSTNPSSDSLTIVSSGTGDIKLNGNADSQMSIFAPFATVRFSGTQGFHGSALGLELHINGTADLEPMGDLTPIEGAGCSDDEPTEPPPGTPGTPDKRTGPQDGSDADE